MGLLDKIGKALVEQVPNEEEVLMEYDSYDDVVDDVNVNLDVKENVVEDIYASNNLSDTSKSIFKVEEAMNSLPKNMVTEAKKTSVVAILSMLGLSDAVVVLDGEKRIDTLTAAKEQMNIATNNDIFEMETSIEEFKQKIADLEGNIAMTKAEMKTVNSDIETEIEKIKSLIEFINGGVAE